MNRWSEIKQAALNTLFMSESEAQSQNYLEKFPHFANEALNTIANAVKPKIAELVVRIPDPEHKTFVSGFRFAYDKDLGMVNYDDDEGIRHEEPPQRNTIYFESPSLMYMVIDDKLTRVYRPYQVFQMPNDFISFYNTVDYVNGENADAHITYVGRDKISLDNFGVYHIYYNALWKEIDKEDMDKDLPLEIDESILNCLPSYIASRVLLVDDVQRATILKNDFELQLSRLDTDTLTQNEHFHSIGGWY